jgi:hypothetical protein
LDGLSWPDLAPTAEGTCSDPAHLEGALRATVTSSNAPARYLRGMLLLSKGDGFGALHAFQSVPVAGVPVHCLYAPYRLHGELHPDRPNPFRAPLVRAATEGRLPPLIEARVLAREANVAQSLQAYLRSDPSQWAAHDLELFPLLVQHAGFGPEAQRMLRAALRAGRVKPELRGKMEALATAAPAADVTAFKGDLRRWLQGDAQGRELAGRVAIQQLEIRRRFLRKEYAELLRGHAHVTPASQPDETVLLLTLSAATQGDTPALDRWSQELKRRHPQPEVEQWLGSLKPAAR